MCFTAAELWSDDKSCLPCAGCIDRLATHTPECLFTGFMSVHGLADESAEVKRKMFHALRFGLLESPQPNSAAA